MGIKLKDITVRREMAEGELRGRIVAFDAHNMLYQFLSSIRTREGHPLTNRDGVVISHIKGLFSRTANLISEGVRPVFVFDGEPHELKKGTLDLRRERKERAQKEWDEALERGDIGTARTKAMQTSRLTDDMIELAVRLIELMGTPHLTAPADGEAQASHMCNRGEVYAASSQDFDSLLFGCPLLIRNLGITGRRKLPNRRSWINVSPEVIDLRETLSDLGITRKQLVDMAILMGTDFNQGIRGIGPKKGLKMIRKWGDLETVSREKRLPLLEYQRVREIFLDPDVTDDYRLEFSRPDESGIRELLVDELGFSPDGVNRTLDLIGNDSGGGNQSSLDSFC